VDCEKRITQESGFCKNRFFKKRIDKADLKAVGNIIAFFIVTSKHNNSLGYNKVTSLASIRILMDPHAITTGSHQF
jgi:hypothetical protein